MPLGPKLIAIVLGIVFLTWGDRLARQNTASFRNIYRREVPLPKMWPYFFRGFGLLSLACGLTMTLWDWVAR